MSYDLDLFRPPPHGDALEFARAAYTGDDDGRPAAPPSGWRERMQALAAALAAAEPALSREDVDTGTDGEHVELYAPDDGSGLQVLLFADAAYAHLPYVHAGADARAAWEQAWRCLQVLERHGGYRTYDPQLDRVLDLSSDRDAVLEEYARGVQITAAIAAEARAPARRADVPRPWWKFWG